MGGFTNNPELPEAPEYPPENAFDIQSFTAQMVKALRDQKVPGADADTQSNILVDSAMKTLAALFSLIPDILKLGGASLVVSVETILKVLIEVAGVVLQPGMDVLGDLTRLYVGQFVTGQTEIRRGEATAHPEGLKPAAAGMFDSILAPMAGLYGAKNPAVPGAGEINSQFALGSIISIHLSTWMINIMSNLTGIGVLKFINSFDDVITTAINSRSLGRIALKPYLSKFMAEPLDRDLNRRLPLDQFSPSTLVKSYLRGAITRQHFIAKMREKGYAEEVAEQLLLDTAKMLPMDALVYLVRTGKWTEDQALEHLKQQGYPEQLAPTVFYLAINDLVFSQMRGVASDLVSARGDRRIDNETMRHILGQLELTEDEISIMATRGAIQAELPKRLSLSQVNSLFQEGLVDLDYVLTFLAEEGYSSQDADLLALLEFTKKDEREKRAAEIAARRRAQADAAAAKEAAAEAKRQAELLKLA